MPAIEELFLNSEHRYYVRHIYINFRKTYREKALKDKLWNCAKASSLPAYEKTMDMLNGMSSGVCEYMKKTDPHHWSRAHFQIKYKCDILLNNLCECFNIHILKARIKWIVIMNEIIRTKLMIRIQKKWMI